MNFEDIIDWDKVDDEYTMYSSCENGITFHTKSHVRLPLVNYTSRPRKFEDGAFYPVIFRRSRTTNVAQYNAKTCSFSTENRAFHKDFFSFIGEKLPDSLWGE